MKKKLLFVIDSLGIGGAEKSLVTLLNQLDFSKYHIDLQMFGYGRSMEKFLPSNVNVLPPFRYTQFLSQPIWKQLSCPTMLLGRLIYSFLILKKNLLHSEKAVLYWKTIGRFIEKNPEKYDVAIAYAQGVPTFYTVDKVFAHKKLTWVNIDYWLEGATRDYQRKYYELFDIIVNVSEYVRDVFCKVYPEFSDKMQVLRDLINAQTIELMSRLPTEKNLNYNFPILMTVGRLEKNQKGYDLALESAKILKLRNINFTWYAIGEGGYRKEMEKYIKDNGLEDYFILIGSTANPYAYMSQCNIYVQPSRHEGFGLTIAEALILNKPVVCTNFEGCTMQIAHKKNGLITSFRPEDIADAIELLLNDKNLYSSIQNYIGKIKTDNIQGIDKFYQLIEK